MLGNPAPPTVVLVDDTPDIRALVRMVLERGGDFRVIGEAGDGASGVDLCESLQPDVVLLDVAMPVMDGATALPLIRSRCQSSTVIMLSALDARQMTESFLRAGADGYVQKGRSIRELLEQVLAVHRQARAGREEIDRRGPLRGSPGDGLGARPRIDPEPGSWPGLGRIWHRLRPRSRRWVLRPA